MENTNQGFATKKMLSILFMALAFVMLNMSWMKFSGSTMEELDDIVAEFEDRMDEIEDLYDGDIEDALEEEGYSRQEIKEATKIIDATKKMIDVLGEGKYSVWSAVSMFSAVSDLKPLMAAETAWGGADEDAVEAAAMLQIVFGIIVGIFAFIGLLMILAIWAHIRNKRSLGIGAMVFSSILAFIAGFFGLIIRFGTEEAGNGVTIAPLLMVVFVIASCITWAMARKVMPSKEEDTSNQLI